MQKKTAFWQKQWLAAHAQIEQGLLSGQHLLVCDEEQVYPTLELVYALPCEHQATNISIIAPD